MLTSDTAFLNLKTDAENPVISDMPSNTNQNTDPASPTAAVTWTSPTATDNSGAVTLISSHNPGDLFNIGTTTVTYTATDSSSNEVTSSFDVIVAGNF